ncbi:MAG: metallophosphoesterase [Oscillospiraceae bacterium]|nr:metallophosphoesterase [Oscillospiraceae bacterium]
MKILVMSDSHGNKDNMLDAISAEAPELILHLGDNIKDCEVINLSYPDIPLRTVKGNCDIGYSGLEMDEFKYGGKRFFMTHGHLYGVKTNIRRIVEAAIYRDVDVLLFGHTHIPYHSAIEGLMAVNPGSIGDNLKSYAILEIENKTISCELKRVLNVHNYLGGKNNGIWRC